MRTTMGGHIVTIALALGQGGCTDQLYVGSDTVLGIAVGYNTAREAGRIDIGYDRHFVTWVPQSVAVQDTATPGPKERSQERSQEREAMSVIGCTELKIGSLSLQGFHESLAIGKAAEAFAAKLRDSAAYFPCFQGKETAP